MTLRTVSPADGSGAVSISWDYAQITVPAGSVVDIEPGSALEAAYGLANLTRCLAWCWEATRRATAAPGRTTTRRLAWHSHGSW